MHTHTGHPASVAPSCSLQLGTAAGSAAGGRQRFQEARGPQRSLFSIPKVGGGSPREACLVPEAATPVTSTRRMFFIRNHSRISGLISSMALLAHLDTSSQTVQAQGRQFYCHRLRQWPPGWHCHFISGNQLTCDGISKVYCLDYGFREKIIYYKGKKFQESHMERFTLGSAGLRVTLDSCWNRRVPRKVHRPLQIHEIKAILIFLLRLYLLLSWCWHLHRWDESNGKRNHWYHSTHQGSWQWGQTTPEVTFSWRPHSLVSLKNVLHEAGKSINFIISLSLIIHFLNILHDERGWTYEVLLCSQGRSCRKNSSCVIELQAKLATFFMKHHLHLTTDNYSYSKEGFLCVFTLKINKRPCWFKENNWEHFLSMVTEISSKN